MHTDNANVKSGKAEGSRGAESKENIPKMMTTATATASNILDSATLQVPISPLASFYASLRPARRRQLAQATSNGRPQRPRRYRHGSRGRSAIASHWPSMRRLGRGDNAISRRRQKAFRG